MNSQSRKELLPCPFCGESPFLSTFAVPMVVNCPNKKCIMHFGHNKLDHYENNYKKLWFTVEEWNARATSELSDRAEFKASLQRNQEIFDMGVEHGRKPDSDRVALLERADKLVKMADALWLVDEPDVFNKYVVEWNKALKLIKDMSIHLNEQIKIKD